MFKFSFSLRISDLGKPLRNRDGEDEMASDVDISARTQIMSLVGNMIWTGPRCRSNFVVHNSNGMSASQLSFFGEVIHRTMVYAVTHIFRSAVLSITLSYTARSFLHDCDNEIYNLQLLFVAVVVRRCSLLL
jgi:hypothetical protein